MIQTIVTYLNAKLATLGRFDTHYCLTERRRREGDGATIPYSYTGAGEYVAVDIDNGSSTWWRGRSGFTLEPVTVVGRAVKQQQGSYPLRLIAILRRKDSTSDDAFMPSRLAEDIANVLNFENGDLRTMLGAWSVTSRATGGEYDTTAIWTSEFQTTVSDLDYKICMVSVDVTIDVVADYKCWEGECETDPDILHLFNFCDSSVVARLTDEQRECLREALPTPCADADWSLTDTDGNELDSGSIPSGGSQVIVAPDGTVLRDGLPFGSVLSGGTIDVPSAVTPCADATVELNGVQMATIASGDTENIEVRQSSGATLVGSQQGQHWRIGDSDIEINGTQVASVKAEDGLDIPVIQDGSPVGSWNGTQWVIPSCPTDLTIEIQIADTTDTAGPFTITANSAGTISAVNDGGLTNLVIEVNGTPDTAPFALAVGDTIEFSYDTTVAATVITLTGTY